MALLFSGIAIGFAISFCIKSDWIINEWLKKYVPFGYFFHKNEYYEIKKIRSNDDE